MNRPPLMRIKPLWLREKIYFRLYRNASSKFQALFEEASLAFAPEIRLRLCPTDVSHQQLAFTGFYELAVSQKIVRLAKKGGILADVGANYGYYSCLWAGGRQPNRVLAFEPAPQNLLALRENLKRNGFEERASVYEVAAGKQKGRMEFDPVSKEQTGWGGLATQASVDSLEVEVVCLDEVLLRAGLNKIDVLKIDVEGADAWVLEGAAGLLRNHKIAHIFFEENQERREKLGIARGEAQSLLHAFDYEVKNLGRNEWYAFLSLKGRQG